MDINYCGLNILSLDEQVKLNGSRKWNVHRYRRHSQKLLQQVQTTKTATPNLLPPQRHPTSQTWKSSHHRTTFLERPNGPTQKTQHNTNSRVIIPKQSTRILKLISWTPVLSIFFRLRIKRGDAPKVSWWLVRSLKLRRRWID